MDSKIVAKVKYLQGHEESDIGYANNHRCKEAQSSSQLLSDRLRDHIVLHSVFPQFSKGDKVAILKDSEDYSRCFC